jgi:hypothetical protein
MSKTNEAIEDDSVLDAHARRQAAWEEDAKVMFRGPDELERRRTKILEELGRIEADRNRRLAEEAKAKEEADAKAAAPARMDAIADELEQMKTRMRELRDEQAAIKKFVAE